MATRIDSLYYGLLPVGYGSNYTYSYLDPFSTPYNMEYATDTLKVASDEFVMQAYGSPWKRRFKYNKSDGSITEDPNIININGKDYSFDGGKPFTVNQKVILFADEIKYKFNFPKSQYIDTFAFKVDPSKFVTDNTSNKLIPVINIKINGTESYTIYTHGYIPSNPTNPTNFVCCSAMVNDNKSQSDIVSDLTDQIHKYHCSVGSKGYGLVVSSLGIITLGISTYKSIGYSKFNLFNEAINTIEVTYYNKYDHYYTYSYKNDPHYTSGASGNILKRTAVNPDYSPYNGSLDGVLFNHLPFGINFGGYEEDGTISASAKKDLANIIEWFEGGRSDFDQDMAPAFTINYFYGNSIVDGTPYVESEADPYPWSFKPTTQAINQTVQLKDTYSQIDRWFRVLSMGNNGWGTGFTVYGNTDPKFTPPTNISIANPLVPNYTGGKDYSIHLKEKLVFDYPKIFQSLSGKNCFNDGFFHFRIRLSSIPTSGDIRLAQFCGVTVGYGVSNSKFFISPYSVYSNTFANYREEATNTTTINTTDGFSVDIVVLDKQYGVYIDRQLTIVSSNNFLPVVDSDNSIKFSDPIINPNVEYDIDDILVCFTRCDSLLGK